MPDSPARPGPPIPPASTERTAPRGPYGLPFPRPSVNPPRRNRPDAPRRAGLVPQPSGEPVVADETPERRPIPVVPSPAPTLIGTGDLPTFVRIVLVVAFVIGALWADRGRPEPVAGLGVVPQPGIAADIRALPDHAGRVDLLVTGQ